MEMQRVPLSAFGSGVQITTRQGWDEGPPDVKEIDPKGEHYPRIHPCVDFFRAGYVETPIEAYRSQWIRKDNGGNSVLRLYTGDEESRLYHFRESEIDRATLALAIKGKAIPKGAKIAIPGDVGISFGRNGGRHVHAFHIIRPGVFDAELTATFGNEWEENLIEKQYMDLLDRDRALADRYACQIEKWNIKRINRLLIERTDPFWKTEVYVLNFPVVFGEGGIL